LLKEVQVEKTDKSPALTARGYIIVAVGGENGL
jgi:hypothetical protein